MYYCNHYLSTLMNTLFSVLYLGGGGLLIFLKNIAYPYKVTSYSIRRSLLLSSNSNIDIYYYINRLSNLSLECYFDFWCLVVYNS